MNFTETLDINPIFKLVSDSAKQLNIKAFVVGGFVRDLILQRPSKDIDIVCVGSGVELAELVAKNS
jgi:poly(A) polymerase